MKRIAWSFLASLLASLCFAQEWPSRPVRIVVPFPAGGSADLLPRLVGERLAARWGQPVVIENRAGAAGNIGAEAVYKSEPDGYTLLAAPPAPLVTNKLVYARLPYDPDQFAPMTVIAAIPNVLLVHPNVAAGTLAEFIALVKGNPGKFNYASQGSGTTSHLTAELFKTMAGGLQITHVPYKGTAPALADLLSGQVEMMCDNLGVSLPHVRAGKLRALGVGSDKRIAALPEVPALAETLPGFQSAAWFGIVGPPRTPVSISEKVSYSVREVLNSIEIQRRLAELSADPIGSSPAAMAEFMKQETARWGAVIRSAGVKAD